VSQQECGEGQWEGEEGKRGGKEGEKKGGRDSWREHFDQYARQQLCTINLNNDILIVVLLPSATRVW
jgi:hypothetical protein